MIEKYILYTSLYSNSAYAILDFLTHHMRYLSVKLI